MHLIGNTLPRLLEYLLSETITTHLNSAHFVDFAYFLTKRTIFDYHFLTSQFTIVALNGFIDLYAICDIVWNLKDLPVAIPFRTVSCVLNRFKINPTHILRTFIPRLIHYSFHNNFWQQSHYTIKFYTSIN